MLICLWSWVSLNFFRIFFFSRLGIEHSFCCHHRRRRRSAIYISHFIHMRNRYKRWRRHDIFIHQYQRAAVAVAAVAATVKCKKGNRKDTLRKEMIYSLGISKHKWNEMEWKKTHKNEFDSVRFAFVLFLLVSFYCYCCYIESQTYANCRRCIRKLWPNTSRVYATYLKQNVWRWREK